MSAHRRWNIEELRIDYMIGSGACSAAFISSASSRSLAAYLSARRPASVRTIFLENRHRSKRVTPNWLSRALICTVTVAWL